MSTIEVINRKISNLEAKKEPMIEYARLKLNEGDYHGLADAAMDLRDIESALRANHELLDIAQTHAVVSSSSASSYSLGVVL